MPETGIKGSILCRRSDDYGEIVVAEEGAKRSLYFGAGIMQSTIRTDRPDLLLEDYNEAMMSALIFQSAPKSVLLIGLGGCSLVHFLLKAAPDCAFDIVEIRKNVIDLSRDFFFLPSQNPNVRIFHADAVDFIRDSNAKTDQAVEKLILVLRQAQHERLKDNIFNEPSGHPEPVEGRPDRFSTACYDMIIVDAFDETGPAASLLEKTFLSSCRMRINEHGVFVINLWNSPAHNFAAMYNAIQDAFEGNALKLLLTESYRNAVAFGFKNPATCRNLPYYRGQAAELQSKYRIIFPRYLKKLYWQNFKEQEQ